MKKQITLLEKINFEELNALQTGFARKSWPRDACRRALLAVEQASRAKLAVAPLAALIAFPLHSQSMAESEGTFTVTPSFVSAFMDRGARQSGFSFQPTIGYARGQLALELFCNFPISDKIPETADPQIDLAAFYTWTVVTDMFEIKPGITLSTLPRARESEGVYKVTWEPSVFFCYTLKGIQFSLNFYYDLTMQGPTYEFGADYTIPLQQLGFDIELSALAGRCDWAHTVPESSAKVRNEGDYWQAGLSIPIEFSKNSKLTVGWYYEKGLNNHFYEGDSKIPNHDAIGRGVFSVGFAYTF